MRKSLDQLFKWKLTNVPVLEKPVLIVFDYSPTDDMPPLSIAFDTSGGRKCWLSEPRVMDIGDKGPNAHSDYKEFKLHGRIFHPFSIEPFSASIFENVAEFTDACRSLYQHVQWE